MAVDKSMAKAVAEQPASSAEYNKIVGNVLDLGDRMYYAEQNITTAQSKNTDQDSAITANASAITSASNKLGTGVGTSTNTTSGTATAQLTSLRSRVGTLESAPPPTGGGITQSGFLSIDPNNVGFQPTANGVYQPYKITGQANYIQFANPGTLVTVYGCIIAHFYNNTTDSPRGGLMIGISADGGTTWQTPPTSPLGRIPSGVDTIVESAQFSFSGTPTGVVRVRALGMMEQRPSANTLFFRPTLYAQMLGGAGATYG